MVDPSRFGRLSALSAAALLLLTALAVVRPSSLALGQEEPAVSGETTSSDVAESPQAGAGAPGAGPSEATDAPPAPAPASEEINILELLISGGFYMIPLAFLSLVVVTFTFERALGLRRGRIIPSKLAAGLDRLSSAGAFDPRKAYRLCQDYPSAASTVVRAMLLKVGRPQAEVEQAVAEASQREADRLYANVRYLTMAAGVAPLIGLLGTVWGMIVAFHDTTRLAPGQNKADFLAEGIYIALVTTLGGLCVAIPAAMIAHYFEGRIQSRFREIDEMMFNLLPQIERYEGRVRFSRQGGELTAPPVAPPPPPVDNRRPAVASPK